MQLINEDPKRTLEGIIKDCLEVIKNNCLMYEDDVYPQQSVCISFKIF